MADKLTKSKIVAKDLGNAKAVLAKEEGDKTPHILGTIIGIARRVQTKLAPNGDAHEQIIGEFEAVNATTGEVYDSGVLYLPGGIHERLSSALKGESVEPIEFAIELSTVRSTNAVGYEYRARSLMETKLADPLQLIREAVAAKKQAQLAAPKAEEKKAAPDAKADHGKGKAA